MEKIIEMLKAAWANPVITTIVVTAAGGALGAVEPMLVSGTLILNAATAHMAVVGAVTAIGALYVQHPINPAPPKV